MGEMRKSIQNFYHKTGLKDNIRMDLREIGLGDVDWMYSSR
jgi:hypothetical protein